MKESDWSYLASSPALEKISFPLYLTGVLDSADPDVMEEFLNRYSFEELDTVYKDDFLMCYKTFKNIYEKNAWLKSR